MLRRLGFLLMLTTLNVSCFGRYAQQQEFPCTQLDGIWQARVAIKQATLEMFERERRVSKEMRDELQKNDKTYSSYLGYLLSQSRKHAPCEIDDPIVMLSSMIPPPGSSDRAVQALVTLLNDVDFDLSALSDLESLIGRDALLNQEWIDKFGSYPNLYIVSLLTDRHKGKRERELTAFFGLLRSSDGYFAEEDYDKLEQNLIADPEWFPNDADISRRFLIEEKRLATSISLGTVEISETAAVYRKHSADPFAKEIVKYLDSFVRSN